MNVILVIVNNILIFIALLLRKFIASISDLNDEHNEPLITFMQSPINVDACYRMLMALNVH